MTRRSESPSARILAQEKMSLIEAADCCQHFEKAILAIARQLEDARGDLPRKKGCRGIGHFSSARHYLYRIVEELSKARVEYWDADNPNWFEDLLDDLGLTVEEEAKCARSTFPVMRSG